MNATQAALAAELVESLEQMSAASMVAAVSLRAVIERQSTIELDAFDRALCHARDAGGEAAETMALLALVAEKEEVQA